MSKACRNCQFFEETDNETATNSKGEVVNLGKCVRHAPAPVWNGHKVTSLIPRVYPNSTCGDFQEPVTLGDEERKVLKELMDG